MEKYVSQYMKTVSRLQAEKGVDQWKEGCSWENWTSIPPKKTSLWQPGSWIDGEYQTGSEYGIFFWMRTKSKETEEIINLLTLKNNFTELFLPIMHKIMDSFCFEMSQAEHSGK